jgi:hypothetical protein
MIHEQLDRIIDEKRSVGRIPILIHLTPENFAIFIHENKYELPEVESPFPYLNYRGLRIVIGVNFVSLSNPQAPRYVKNGVLVGVVQLNQLLAQEFISFEE